MANRSQISQRLSNNNVRGITRALAILAVLHLLALCGRPCGAQAPPTIEAELSRHGIRPTRPALGKALKDKRPEVRGLAAAELAEMRDTASVSLIVDAFNREKNPLVKFNMAAALMLLRSRVGKDYLLHICQEESSSEGVRLDAASRLFDVGDSGCLPSVENILTVTANSSIKVSALLSLTHVKVIPPTLAPRIHILLVVSLQDADSAVRQYATRAIASLSDKDAIPSLQAAIAKESDRSLKEYMEDCLKTLEAQ